MDFFKAGIDISSSFFDAMLMDIEMPVMEGYAAARRIRAWESKVQSSESVEPDDPTAVNAILRELFELLEQKNSRAMNYRRL